MTQDTRTTPDSLPSVPKQTRPPKVTKSLRLRLHLLAQVVEKCERLGLNFNEAVERALEDWVRRED